MTPLSRQTRRLGAIAPAGTGKVLVKIGHALTMPIGGPPVYLDIE